MSKKNSKELETTCPYHNSYFGHPEGHPPHYRPLPPVSQVGRGIIPGGTKQALVHLHQRQKAFAKLTIAERREYIEGLGLTYTIKERRK